MIFSMVWSLKNLGANQSVKLNSAELIILLTKYDTVHRQAEDESY